MPSRFVDGYRALLSRFEGLVGVHVVLNILGFGCLAYSFEPIGPLVSGGKENLWYRRYSVGLEII